MKEYIERESLHDEIQRLSMSITGLRCGKGFLFECMKQYKESVLRIVDEQPTADVVEVVRCKDCKYFYQNGNIKVCKHWNCHSTTDDAYCSYGERRKEDAKIF